MLLTRRIGDALGVADLLRLMRELLESDAELQDLWVRGEISNLTVAASGHCYFSLKEESAAVRCVMFRAAALAGPRLRNGMQVFIHGRASIYEPRGELQIVVDLIEDIGVGVLFQKYQALKDELEALGYFAVERKRPLPVAPRVIGIVTSPDAAALRDMIRTLRLRWPLGRVILAPTLVQGTSAAGMIAGAIRALNAHGAAEVIIVARGGGSIEDLWAFNERVVADAIFTSRLPVVSGVGHETDFTIADFVADYRAATPTAAAAAVAPDVTMLRAAIAGSRERLLMVMQETVDHWRDEVATLEYRLQRIHPRAQADRARQQVDDATQAMRAALQHRLDLARERLSGAALRLQALSPLLTIARGFAQVTRDRDGLAVTCLADVAPPEAVTIRVADGRLAATVTATAPGN